VIAPYRQFSVRTVDSFHGQERDIIAIKLKLLDESTLKA
jgi:hypothetical protein